MARYAIMISAPISAPAAHQRALQFCQALCIAGHQIAILFFHGEAVAAGSHLLCPPGDELDIHLGWKTLADHAPLRLCSTSALRYGVIDATEAEDLSLDQHNLVEPFIIAGLGEWVTCSAESDKVIQF